MSQGWGSHLYGEWAVVSRISRGKLRLCEFLRNQDLGLQTFLKLCPSLQSSLVPLTPVLSTLLNICLMRRLNNLTWLRFSIWS